MQSSDDPQPMVAKLTRINAALIRRVDQLDAARSSTHSLARTAAVLEKEVLARNRDLERALAELNAINAELASAREAGVADWDTQDVVALLKTGTSMRGSVMGPMADVVFGSTQYLSDADLQAMAVFLKALPQQTLAPQVAEAPEPAQLSSGAKIYKEHCAQCHGEQGEGARGAYPALAGNRVVTMDSPANLVQIVLHGGFAPATDGNPRPYGMPPFQQTLDGPQIAAVLTYIRQAWGNAASAVSPLEVLQHQ